MSGGKRTWPAWIRFSGLGIEFAASVAGFTLVGLWIDRHYDTRPWGVVVGAMLGILGAMVNLIRQSLSVSKEISHKSKPGGREG